MPQLSQNSLLICLLCRIICNDCCKPEFSRLLGSKHQISSGQLWFRKWSLLLCQLVYSGTSSLYQSESIGKLTLLLYLILSACLSLLCLILRLPILSFSCRLTLPGLNPGYTPTCQNCRCYAANQIPVFHFPASFPLPVIALHWMKNSIKLFDILYYTRYFVLFYLYIYYIFLSIFHQLQSGSPSIKISTEFSTRVIQ